MIVGTAGHIDHGKTALVRALTGVDTDRLKEEKARGITIELGFAYLPLEGGGRLGFVDVPGHERLVHTMLAGAAGIDFVLLVIAADDGVMPQTREHVEILRLLGLDEGLIVITKADLVDGGRIEQVEAEARGLLGSHPLGKADAIAVSSHTGAGIETLRLRLAEETLSRPTSTPSGAFRLSVDRSFSLAGAGTIVTGAVTAGAVKVGDPVVVLPGGLSARVRSLHALGEPAEAARQGQRAALNLSGPDIRKEAIGRGDWITAADAASMSQRFDAEVRLLASEKRPLATWSPVFVHVGASAELARAVILSAERLAPGATALVQLLLPRSLPLRHGDRLVLRDQGALRTIGGGRILDPRAPTRRRRTPERRAVLDAMAEPEPSASLAALLDLAPGLVALDDFGADRGLTSGELEALIVPEEMSVIGAPGQRTALRPAAKERLLAEMRTALAAFHASEPAQPGMPPERLRRALPSRLGLHVYSVLVEAFVGEGGLGRSSGGIHLPGYTSSLAAADLKLWERIKPHLEAERMHPPTAREIAETISTPVANVRRVAKLMARLGEVVEVASDRFFLRSALLDLGRLVRDLAKASPTATVTAAEFRDRSETGRNIAIQVLEHFDRAKLTFRQGDARRVVGDPEKILARHADRR